ncbi:MAG: bifunctional phosphoribosyl-AMP cyclohydrolase/phosphoribosyl-ATP diphosphatase [Chloroflexi bacterium]|jgi:phosphoribosyl-ATP pyrophosphohydrolase/phosphoribosyl-AMP cyclohydrolase|nr:bifunctional phosphoribosyl-AMP cyclohydrolase/phosphoribosyl-ATP diphosphatase [Chloroflexota bacterium]MDP7196681.1 bifunctional phosphoribosyl-AMP cyclohydrolase/phosphoribosyl-ATP diphosphatase HisIE [SAR202 cluster bacterium]|tara:strand:+ start:3473 stop:4072 length:600 start_codon:yes stop_codon:yes gene_type:complete
MNENIKFNKSDLIPAIIQNHNTNEILMLGYMNQESINMTMNSGHVWFYSRSRKKLWEKGEKSGNYLKVINLALDCDKDTILIKAIPNGPTCHKGNTSCFGEENKPVENTLNSIISIINERNKNKNPDSYTSKLLNEGMPKIAQKIVEEAGELSIASLTDKNNYQIIYEFSDLLFHMLVLLKKANIDIENIWDELESRKK